MSLLGYRHVLTMKVERSKHRVGFCNGQRACDLIEMLKLVPQDAIVECVFSEHDDYPGVTTIDFIEEKESA